MNNPLLNTAALKAAVTASTFEMHDIVRLNSGHQLIIVDHKPNRPANPWLGILVKGYGKMYKFGYKHQPVKVGHASPTHPALMAYVAKNPTHAATTNNKTDAGLSFRLNVLAASIVKALANGQLRQARDHANNIVNLIDNPPSL